MQNCNGAGWKLKTKCSEPMKVFLIPLFTKSPFLSDSFSCELVSRRICVKFLSNKWGVLTKYFVLILRGILRQWTSWWALLFSLQKNVYLKPCHVHVNYENTRTNTQIHKSKQSKNLILILVALSWSEHSLGRGRIVFAALKYNFHSPNVVFGRCGKNNCKCFFHLQY